MTDQDVPPCRPADEGRRVGRHRRTVNWRRGGQQHRLLPPDGEVDSGNLGTGSSSSSGTGSSSSSGTGSSSSGTGSGSGGRDGGGSGGGDAAAVGRRRALAALGGAAAVAAGGAAFSTISAGRDLADWVAGSGTDAADLGAGVAGMTGDSAARPGGRQPSTVRTYTEQNESYMGSRAGVALRRNVPAAGRLHASPAAAARATRVTVETVLAKDPVRHLASRATFGATPEVLADLERMGIDGWLRWQLDPDKIAPSAAELKLAELPTLRMSISQLRARRATGKKRGGTNPADEMVWATIARQIWSGRQLFEVMVDFWNDFLHVAAYVDDGTDVRALFDRDVIRAHTLGTYADMLVAANRHPALLRYLNQDRSRKDAVNENLARENLELYSVGVDGGYTETDVRQAALLQTGLGIDNDDEYVYRPERHHVGPVRILGFRHANGSAADGERVIEAYLRYLALHPATGRYVAQNLATRFVSDTPPRSLVDRLAKAYTENGSAIKPVLMTLFSSSEFWAAVGQKVRRPMEYLVATYRVLGVAPEPTPGYRHTGGGRTAFAEGLRQIKETMAGLGQFPAGISTPNGYPDVYVAWTSAGAMVGGWNEAGDLINGGRQMFSYHRPEGLVGAPPTDAGEYVDALAKRLVHQPLTARQRALLLDIAAVPATARVDATLNGAVAAVARALLASPAHHLR